MDGYLDGQTDGQKFGRIDRWTEVWTDRPTDGSLEGQWRLSNRASLAALWERNPNNQVSPNLHRIIDSL